MSPGLDGKKYIPCPRPRIKGKKKRLSHIVMEKMIGRSIKKGEVVHHKNDDTSDNRPENLEVMTISEHIKHHMPRDYSKYGVSAAEDKSLWSKRYNRAKAAAKGIPPRITKIDKKAYFEIRDMLTAGIQKKEIAEKYNINRSIVYRIGKGTRLQHFRKEYENARFRSQRAQRKGSRNRKRVREMPTRRKV